MTSGYQPSTPPCCAATATEPAPSGYPGRSTLLMLARTRGRSAGLSGGGRTAATTSGSVSQTATTPVDQMSGRLELFSRDAAISASVRAPYRTRAMYRTTLVLSGVGSVTQLHCHR